MDLNIQSYLAKVDQYFSPKIVNEVNDVFIKVAKIKGEKVPWHIHEEDDELFYVLKGELFMQLRDRNDFVMGPGDIFVVPKGIEHRVSSEEECHIILIEGKSTEHTGKVESEITKSIDEQQRL